MPSLFDDPHAPTLNPDAQTVLDALCFLQSPINITRLAEFLGDHPTARGTHFHGPELRRLLGELHAAKRVGNTAQGQWFAPPEVACTKAPTRPAASVFSNSTGTSQVAILRPLRRDSARSAA